MLFYYYRPDGQSFYNRPSGSATYYLRGHAPESVSYGQLEVLMETIEIQVGYTPAGGEVEIGGGFFDKGEIADGSVELSFTIDACPPTDITCGSAYDGGHTLLVLAAIRRVEEKIDLLIQLMQDQLAIDCHNKAKLDKLLLEVSKIIKSGEEFTITSAEDVPKIVTFTRVEP